MVTMPTRRTRRSLPLLLLLVILTSAPSFQQPHHPRLDLPSLQANGRDWKLIRGLEEGDGGQALYHHDMWAMFFLHWRPLPPEEIAWGEGFARDLMLNFWGPEMPFVLEPGARSASVAGHEALEVRGSIYEGSVETRFLVWICPESRRLFVADMNINLRAGTHPSVMEEERSFAETVACHRMVGETPAGWHRLDPAGLDVSLAHPPAWNAARFPSSEWYPHGPDRKQGTIWALPRLSELFTALTWTDPDGPGRAEESVLTSRFLSAPFEIAGGGPFRFEVSREPQGVERILLVDERAPETGTRSCRTVSSRWREGGRTFHLLLIAPVTDSVWERPIDLSPPSGAMELILEEELLPAFRAGRVP